MSNVISFIRALTFGENLYKSIAIKTKKTIRLDTAKSNLLRLSSEVLLLPDEELLEFLCKELTLGVAVCVSSIDSVKLLETVLVSFVKGEEVEVSKFEFAEDVSEETFSAVFVSKEVSSVLLFVLSKLFCSKELFSLL